MTWITLAFAFLAGQTSDQQTSHIRGDSFRFAVAGHLRGDPTDGITNRLLPEFLADIRRTRPSAVFLAGDSVWGDYHGNPIDRDIIEREWSALDDALAALEAPVYRVPGNHEFGESVSRDVYYERYGTLPRAVTIYGCRFLLLCSAWVPPDGYSGGRPHIRGIPLDADQIAFVQAQLADPTAYEHAFVVLHHLLWWEEDSPWWRDVHPLLVGKKVRAVFSGEYGPYKYSHLRRDGIDYLQAAFENSPALAHMRARESSRLLSQLMDVYLLVHVDGPSVRVEVRPIGATSSGNYSPQRWRDVYAYRSAFGTKFHKGMVRYPVAGLLGAGFAGLFAGLVAARLLRRGRRVRRAG